MSGLIPSRGIRWLLLVFACLAAISMFLLATASANTQLFARRYDLLLVLNGALVVLLMAPLVIGAIGVVFGDIGTSPLYTMRQCFTGTHQLSLAPENVLGILSIIFWSLVIVVTLKYVTLIMAFGARRRV